MRLNAPPSHPPPTRRSHPVNALAVRSAYGRDQAAGAFLPLGRGADRAAVGGGALAQGVALGLPPLPGPPSAPKRSITPREPRVSPIRLPGAEAAPIRVSSSSTASSGR